MVDWLHCNACFHQPGDGLKFSLTSCGHIYCERCIYESCKEKCKMCGSSCNTILLTGQMKPEVELYFTEPMDLVKKNLKQVIQVMDFQRNHRRRFISYIRDKITKQQSKEEKICKAIEQTQDMEREIVRLKEENSYLKRLINEKGIGLYSMRTMVTPPGRSQASMFSPIYKGSSGSPVQTSHPRGSQSSLFHSQISQLKMTQSGHGHISGMSASAGRLSIRTPPSDGRIGTIAGTPSPKNIYSKQITPKSVPHPIIGFSNVHTPPVGTR